MSQPTTAEIIKSAKPYQPTKPLCSVGNLPVMLTTDTCAALGNVSRKHVCDLLNEGAIKGVKVGTAWRVPRDGFLAYLGLKEA